MTDSLQSKLKTLIKSANFWFYLSISLIFITVSFLSIFLFEQNDFWYIILLSFLSSVIGFISILVASEKKYWTFILGIISAQIFGFLSLYWGIYLTAILQYAVITPLSLWGIYKWVKNYEADKKEVIIRKMDYKFTLLFISLALILSIPLFFLIYELFNNGNSIALIWFDAANFTFSTVALTLSVLRYQNTWILWTVVNIIGIVIFCILTINSLSYSAAIIQLLTKLSYLATSLWGWYLWSKKTNSKKIA